MEIGRTGRVQVEDIVFLVRKDQRKYARVKDLLTMNEELKKARKAFDEVKYVGEWSVSPIMSYLSHRYLDANVEILFSRSRSSIMIFDVDLSLWCKFFLRTLYHLFVFLALFVNYCPWLKWTNTCTSVVRELLTRDQGCKCFVCLYVGDWKLISVILEKRNLSFNFQEAFYPLYVYILSLLWENITMEVSLAAQSSWHFDACVIIDLRHHIWTLSYLAKKSLKMKKKIFKKCCFFCFCFFHIGNACNTMLPLSMSLLFPHFHFYNKWISTALNNLLC